MALTLRDNGVSRLYLGDDQILTAYLGDDLVFDGRVPVVIQVPVMTATSTSVGNNVAAGIEQSLDLVGEVVSAFFAAEVEHGHAIGVPTLSATATAFVPPVATGTSIEVPVLDISGEQFVASTDPGIEPDTLEATAEFFAPDVQYGQAIDVPVMQVFSSMETPVIGYGVEINAPVLEGSSNIESPEVVLESPVSAMGMNKGGSDQNITDSTWVKLSGMVTRSGYTGPSSDSLIADGDGTRDLVVQIEWLVNVDIDRRVRVVRNGSVIGTFTSSGVHTTTGGTITGVVIANGDEFEVEGYAANLNATTRIVNASTNTHLYWNTP